MFVLRYFYRLWWTLTALGAGCKILGGVLVGNGIVVGANAVVLNSIYSYSIAVGVPARIHATERVSSITKEE
jgi:serine acetyltransferase